MAGMLSPDILDFVDSITGSGAVNLPVVYPKIRELRAIAADFLRELGSLGEALRAASYPEQAAGVEALACAHLESFDEQFCTPALTAAELLSHDKDFRAAYGEQYRLAKNCAILTHLLTMTGAMQWAAPRILPADGGAPPAPATLAAAWAWAQAENPDRVRGVQLLPPEAVRGLDLAQLVAAAGAGACEPLWAPLCACFRLGDRAFNILEQPDFDPDALCGAVTESLTSLRQQVRRAGAGFALIENGASLFKSNASKYQRRVEATNNPLEIFTGYLEDLQAAAESSDQRTRIALLRIIRHIQTMTNRVSASGVDTAGTRLMKTISKSVGAAAAEFGGDVDDGASPGSGDGGAAPHDDITSAREELRRTREADRAAATAAADEMLAAAAAAASPGSGDGGEAVLLPQTAAGGADAASRDLPQNIDELTSWIEGGAAAAAPPKKKKKKKKKSARS
jgi:hypothetical protein